MKTPPASPPAKWSRPLLPKHAAVDDAFTALCNAALAQIAANAQGVARGADPEYLHQLRVGMRRLLSLVRAFRPLLRRKRARAAMGPLRKMMRVFGTVRDWDVFCLTLERAKVPNELVARARRKRAAVARAAHELADSPAFHEAQLAVVRWLNGKPWRRNAVHGAPLLDHARRSLERKRRKLGERARRIDWRDAARRHAVRIAVKRLRYGCDFFAACFPQQAVRPFLARLAKLQDTLGELNDISVAYLLLKKLRDDGAEVRHRLARRERARVTSLAKEWAAFERLRPYWQPQPAPRAGRRTPRALASRA